MKTKYILSSLDKDINTSKLTLDVKGRLLNILTNCVFGVNLGEVSLDEYEKELDKVISGGLVYLLGTVLEKGTMYNSTDDSVYKVIDGNITVYEYEIDGMKYRFNGNIINYFKNKSTSICIAKGINCVLFIEKGILVGYLLGLADTFSDVKDLGIDLTNVNITDKTLDALYNYL